MNQIAEMIILAYASNVSAVALYNFVNMYTVHRTAKKNARKKLKFRKHFSCSTGKNMIDILLNSVHNMNENVFIPGLNVLNALTHRSRREIYQKVLDDGYSQFAMLDDTKAYMKILREQIITICYLANVPDDVVLDLIDNKNVEELVETRDKMLSIVKAQQEQNEIMQKLNAGLDGITKNEKKDIQQLTYDDVEKILSEPLFKDSEKEEKDKDDKDDSHKPIQKRLK